MIFLIKTPKPSPVTNSISFVIASETTRSLVFRGRAVAVLESTPAEDYYIATPLPGEAWAKASTKLLYVRPITEEEAATMDDPERFAGHKLSWWESFKRLLGIS